MKKFNYAIFLLGILAFSHFCSSSGLPLFIENVGQFDQRVLFQVWGGGQTLWITLDAIWITLVEPRKPPEPMERSGLFPLWEQEERPRKAVAIRISFPGANPNVRLEPFGRLDTVVSYFIGNDPTKWRVAVPVWSGVRYRGLYPGVDLEVFGEGGNWNWQWIAQNPGDLAKVRLWIEGAENVEVLSARGALRLLAALGEFFFPLPLGETQLLPGPKIETKKPFFEVKNPFTLNPSVAFKPKAENTHGISYAGFLGGSGEERGGYSIAVDATGAAYVIGETWSSDFPTTPGAFETTYRGGSFDAFVAKLTTSGGALAYATFLGGSNWDCARSIAVDTNGAAYVTGYTSSSDFPITPGTFGPTHNGGEWDIFVAKLTPFGNDLIYSTFLGGSDMDMSYGIAVDASGAAYVTGSTSSYDFPITSGALDSIWSGGFDAFVLKLSPSGTDLVYATFLGGGYGDWGYGIAVDASGAAYVTGETRSSDFPTTPGAFATSGGTYGDAFVAKLAPSGTALAYATFLGGVWYDAGYGISIDASGAAYVTGITQSSDFPTTPDALNTIHNGAYDAFIVKLNSTGTALVYATFLGGLSEDEGYGIAVDASGAAYITGMTWSSDFPTTSGAFDTILSGYGDAFVAVLNPSGSDLLYATFLGGSTWDIGYGIAVDSNGATYVTGVTDSFDFPTTPEAFGTTYNGGVDAFVVKISPCVIPSQGYIAGKVKDASTGQSVQGATVEASGPTTASTTTDSNGNYTLTLPPGTYTLTASATGYQSQTKTGVAVTPEETTMVDFALSPLSQLGCIKGRVTDAVSRQGLKGVKVEAKGPITASATTNSDGSYSLPLPPGRYSVTASIPNFYQPLTKINVNVIKGRDTKLDFALIPIKPGVAFNATVYIRGETITLTVADRAYAGATEIAGTNVLVLEDSSGTVIASWDSVPALPNVSNKFAVSYRLPANIKPGKITVTYTDPAYPGRKAKATAKITLTWSFAILTDLHIGRWYPEPYDGSEYFLTERLRKALQEIKRRNTPSNPIKFVVILGDLSESGEKAQLQKVRKIFEEELGDLPWIPIMGNHDVWARSNGKAHFAEVFSDYLDQLRNNPVFGGTFRTQNYMVDPWDPTDLQNYVFECGGIKFICLDFNSREPLMQLPLGPGADAVLYPTTRAWLGENLSPGQPTVLFSHHPFTPSLMLAFSDQELDSISELIRQSSADVKATFAGHIHGFDGWAEWIDWLPGKQVWFSANKEYPPLLGKIPVVTTEALMVGQNQPKVDKAVVRLVRVKGNSSLSYNFFAARDNAYNPRFDYDQEHFCIEFEADCFTKLPVNKNDYRWEFRQLGIIKRGKEVKLTTKELSRLGSGEVVLDVKLTVKGESISCRIRVNIDSLPSFSSKTITMRAVPNPVRDVHTTVFTVLGVEAEEIRVEVYDLAGRLVWKGEGQGNELPWDTSDLTGLPLANGVYLYLVYVKVSEEWIVSDIQKLVILR